MSIKSPMDANYLADALYEKVLRETEAMIRAEVQPRVDAMIRDAAKAACKDLTAKIETQHDLGNGRVMMLVRFNDRELPIDPEVRS